MSFAASSNPDITYGLPFELSSASTAAYAATTGWDVSIGGLGFNLRPSAQNPYVRATENIRKQQIDTSGEPGEQSFTSWWSRSQSDWSNGAGINWYEPGSDEFSANRFATSHGIDVWTPGQFSLLRSAAASGSAEANTVHLVSARVSGVDGYIKAFTGTATWVPSTGSPASLTLGGTSATKPAVAGRIAYVGTDAGISVCNFTASTVSTPWTAASSTRVWWVKNRMIVAIGAALYSLGASAGAGAISASGTLIYTHPESNWTWTDVAEAGSAILASGYVDNQSGVLAFTIENNGSGVPTLVGGSMVAKMPPGELIYCMGVYLGNVLVMGTSLGIRVGECSPSGEVAYGPLTVETSSPVRDVAFRDRFAYCTITGGLEDGSSGAVRIDLSTPVDPAERRAWAWDVPVGTSGTCASIALVGDRVILAASNTVYEQSATALVSSGYVTSGRIRYATTEPKAFRLSRLEVAENVGTTSLTAITPGGAEVRVISFDSTFSTDEDVTIQVANELTHQWLQFKVTMTPTGTSSPVVTGLTIKAAPAPSRVRMYQFPLSCFNYEKDRWGNTYGTDTGAYDRLTALEGAEEAAAPLRIVDNRTGESFVGIVDSVEFTATEPPSGSQGNFGGIAVVIARRL